MTDRTVSDCSPILALILRWCLGVVHGGCYSPTRPFPQIRERARRAIWLTESVSFGPTLRLGLQGVSAFFAGVNDVIVAGIARSGTTRLQAYWLANSNHSALRIPLKRRARLKA